MYGPPRRRKRNVGMPQVGLRKCILPLLDGDTPLLIAVQQRDLRKVRLLLDAGARVNAAEGPGYSALMYAAMADKLEIVQELLARGADVSAKDKKGFTVLEMAGGQRVRQILTEARNR